MKRWRMLLFGVLGLGVLIQLVPYGHDRTNPPVVAEPAWDSARTRELFFRACKDCHSHETSWPWYAAVAPASWLVLWDVNAARSHFNVSEWGRAENHGDEAADLLRKGDMPLWYYLPAHPEARLSVAETAELVAGLEATFGSAPSDAGESGPAHGEPRPHSHEGHDH